MPRRGYVAERKITADPVYHSPMVSRLINKVMRDGKKSLAESIVYAALDQVRAKTGQDPVEVLDKALKNVMPVVETKPRRVGGATYQVPVEVRAERRISLGLRWIVQYARERNEGTMAERLCAELLDASNGQGASVKKREDTHRMAEANKAFAHYRW